MNKNNMVFAIFGDGKFIAWTYGMFMQLVKQPKMYRWSENQIETVKQNFKSKIRDIKRESDFPINNPIASAIINAGENKDKKKLSDFSTFELRAYRTEHDYDTWVDDINKEKPDYVYKYND